MAAPPKHAGLSFPPEYQARVGRPRTCDTCGAVKEISNRTFAPSKHTPDRVSTTCRSCQGKKSVARRWDGTAAKESEAKTEAKGCVLAPRDHRFAQRVAGWPKIGTKDYWTTLRERVERLYAIAGQVEREDEFNDLCAAFHQVCRLEGDPAGEGKMRDAEIAFRSFIEVVKPVIVDWLPLAPFHSDVIAALLSDHDRVLLLASRNSGKSTLTRVFCAWLLYRDPMDVVMTLSSNERLARKMLVSVRSLLDTVPLLHYLQPTDECPDSAFAFTVPQALGKLGASTSFAAYGITSRKTGTRAKRIIADDIEAKGDDTPESQEKLDDLWAEVDHILQPGGTIKALGTPQVPGISIYGRWSRSGEFEIHHAITFEETEELDANGKPRKVVASRWPARWSDEEMQRKRRRISDREWDLHMACALAALDNDKRPLHLRDFLTFGWDQNKDTFPSLVRGIGPRLSHIDTSAWTIEEDDYLVAPAQVSKETSRYQAVIAALDPSSGLAGRDELGLCIVGVTSSSKAVVRYLSGLRGSSAADTLSKAAHIIASFRPTSLVVEARVDSLVPTQLATLLRQRGYPLVPSTVSSGQRKGDRICDVLEPLVANGRVILLESVLTADDAGETVKQIANVTRDGRNLRHDDRIDALAHALAAAAPMLQADESDNLEVEDRALIEKLAGRSIRDGGFGEWGETMLASVEHDENYIRIKTRLDHLIEMQEEDRKLGRNDAALAQLVEVVKRDLSAFVAASRV